MYLILTEKPNVAKQVKNALFPDAKYVVHIKGSKTTPPVGYYESEEAVICSSVGHIVRLKAPKDIDPQKYGWKLDLLPYSFPDPMPLEVDNKSVFKCIKDLFKKHPYQEIIIATDGDREGQNIWRKISLMLPKQKAPITRMWLSEWTPDGIRNAWNSRFDNSLKEPLAQAARCREESDYLFGMNCTATLTAKFSSGYGNVLSIGRVMGPTMKIVVDRELEIRNFKPEPYLALTAVCASDDHKTSLRLPCKKQKLTSAESAAVRASFPSKLTLTTQTKTVTKRCPELYDATSIAQDMNRKYGFSAKKTSDIIQKLYQDYALTTYPGTNSTKMSEGSAKLASNALKNMLACQKHAKTALKNAWTPAAHVITNEDLAHEAITPVYGSTDSSILSKLSDDEMKVYEAICERFVQVFFPAAEYEETIISTEACGLTWETKGKILKNAGWTIVNPSSKDKLLPKVTNGKTYPAFVEAEKKQTTPPARYTEDTLLSAMKNAGRFVDDKDQAAILKSVEGLGTGRTRPAIIENIKAKNYFTVTKKQIQPTDKCMSLFEVMPETSLSSPALTAHFEQMIQDVEDGKMTYEDYMRQIRMEVDDVVEKIKAADSKTISANASVPAFKKGKKSGGVKMTEWGKCPKCGCDLRENSKAIGCSGYKNGCDFTIWKTVAGKELTEKQIMDLLTKGRTAKIKGFTSRKGTKFDACLKLVDGKVSFDFDDPKPTTNFNIDWGTCPICGSPMEETGRSVRCSDHDCKFVIWKTIAGKDLEPAIIHELITEKQTLYPVTGFKSRKGSSFDALLYWDDGEQKVVFHFPDRRG